MKIFRIWFALFFLLIQSALSLADVEDCSGIDQAMYQSEYKACLRLQIAGSSNVDCIECLFAQEEKTSPWVEALGAVAAPLAYFGATWVGAHYQYKSQKGWANAYNNANNKWANAYEQGHVQCTNRFNSYLDYNTSIGAAPVLAKQAESFAKACNQQPLGQFAGFGGLGGGLFGGGGNPFLSAGFRSRNANG